MTLAPENLIAIVIFDFIVAGTILTAMFISLRKYSKPSKQHN